MGRHWLDRSRLTCHACGHVARSAIEEARHRHNFPTLCKRNKQFERFMEEHHGSKDKG